MAVLPQQDIGLAAAEIRRVAGLPGIVGVYASPTRRRTGGRSSTRCTTPCGAPLRTRECRWACTPSWPLTSTRCVCGFAHQQAAELGAPASRRHGNRRHRQHLLHAGHRQPLRHDELDDPPSRRRSVRALSRTAASSSWRREGDGSSPGWSASITITRSSGGTSRNCRRSPRSTSAGSAGSASTPTSPRSPSRPGRRCAGRTASCGRRTTPIPMPCSRV